MQAAYVAWSMAMQDLLQMSKLNSVNNDDLNITTNDR